MKKLIKLIFAIVFEVIFSSCAPEGDININCPGKLCLNFGPPIINLSISASSNLDACLSIMVNQYPISTTVSPSDPSQLFYNNVPEPDITASCGQGARNFTLTVNLNDIFTSFENPIPDNIIIQARLLINGELTVLDSAKCTITTERICTAGLSPI